MATTRTQGNSFLALFVRGATTAGPARDLGSASTDADQGMEQIGKRPVGEHGADIGGKPRHG
jgi:hypothetical protein